MTELSRLETARRAGVGVDDLRLMVDLGLLVPDEDDHFTASDMRKAAFLSSLMSGGLPLDAVAAEMQRGHLSTRLPRRPGVRALLGPESAHLR